MLNLKLYTYNSNKALKQYIELNPESKIISYAETCGNLVKNEEYIIDLTLICKAIKYSGNDGLIFSMEQSIVNLSNNFNVKFCLSEEIADYVLENLMLVFCKKEKLCEDFQENKETKEEKKDSIIKLKDFTEEQLNNLVKKFNNNLIGHNNFKKGLVKHLKEFRLFNKIGEHKILSIFIFGASGIGKTETAKILHKIIAPSEKMIKLNFGNYSSQGALNSLIGSPRGFIGSEDGELNIKLCNSKSTIILIDEFEKADKTIINFFLELLEDGKYTDMLGIEHNIDGYIIIFTSNLTEEKIIEKIPPEFLNRLNYKVKFNFLNEEDKQIYLERRINDLIKKFNDNNDKTIKEEDKKLFDGINVSKYDNIRDIEQEIKKRFIDITNNIEN